MLLSKSLFSTQHLFTLLTLTCIPLLSQAQTEVLKDINPGISDGYIEYMTVVGDKMFFVADNEEDEGELYVTDGTKEGTIKITDLAPPEDYPDIEELTPLGDKIIFTAVTEEHGDEPYVSDGTVSGTYLLKDIYPGDISSDAEHFGVMSGKAFFPAEDGDYPDANNGEELWITDGTSSGTYLVKDLYPGQTTDPFTDIESNNSSRPDYFFAHNDTMYFSARSGNHGVELWASDGTTDGTYQVKDIFEGTEDDGDPNSSEPKNFMVMDGKLFFTARSDSTYDDYLYTTDGTSGGTVKFLEEPIETIRSTPIEYNGNWYFIVEAQIWKSDGTPEGTSMIIDLSDQDTFIEDYRDVGNQLIPYKDELYFFDTYNLWKTDGTAAGTEQVVSSEFNLFDYHYKKLATVFNNRIYFPASDDGYGQANIAGRELWMSDGTPEGTMYVANLRSGIDRGNPDGSDPENLTILNDKLYFTAEGDSLGREIWMTDGMPQRKAQISDTTRMVEFPDMGFTINFPDITDSFDVNGRLDFNTDADQLEIPDSLTLTQNQSWNITPDTTGLSFNAEVCLSLHSMETAEYDTARLAIIKRSDISEEWTLLNSKVDEELEYICSSNIQSFSDFTIVELPEEDVGVYSEEMISPHSFDLKNAYPNPFNPATTIGYSIPESRTVELTVYNITGQKVATLVNERQSAGRHEVTFEAGQLASGIYFYRLEAGSQRQIRKMTLLK